MKEVLAEKYIYRQCSARLDRLFRTFPVVVVTGARQVGKTTLLRHMFSGRADFVVFDPTADVERAREQPDLFLDNHREPLVLDEVQYAPEVTAAIKRRVDADRRPGRFILTGSQQWGVLKSVSESLAGRAVFLELPGFELAESADAPTTAPSWLEAWLDAGGKPGESRVVRRRLERGLFEQLFRGALPQTPFIPLDAVRAYHQAYQQTYIERDVRLLANVSDYQLFGRFFRLVAALTAQEVNYAQLGRDLGIARSTAYHWLDILRATYQWVELPPYAGNAVKRVSEKTKGYIADTGIAAMGLALSSPAALADHPAMGALFETAAVSEIRKLCLRMAVPPNMFHWRTHGGAEVDLLLERDGRFFPIEVKAHAHPDGNDARGIRAFRKTYPSSRTCRGLVLAPCASAYPLGEDVLVLPWDTAGFADICLQSTIRSDNG